MDIGQNIQTLFLGISLQVLKADKMLYLYFEIIFNTYTSTFAENPKTKLLNEMPERTNLITRNQALSLNSPFLYIPWKEYKFTSPS